MPELLEFEEPVGVLLKEIEALSMSVAERLDARYRKFRRMGEEGSAFTDTGRSNTPTGR